MINESYYNNPEFIVEKNKSIGFDINSNQYKMFKLHTFMSLTNGFIKESIRQEKDMIGMCAVFYIPKDQKEFEIKAMGNILSINLDKYVHTFKNYKMVNIFIPFENDMFNDDVIEKASKLFCFENNPFAIAILRKATSNVVVENTNIEVEIPNVMNHYIEYSDASFNMFSFCNTSCNELNSYKKRFYDKSSFINDISDMSSESMSYFIDCCKDTKSGINNKYLPIPVGIYAILNDMFDSVDLDKRLNLQKMMDGQYPVFNAEFANEVINLKEDFTNLDRLIDLMNVTCIKVYGDSHVKIKDSNSDLNTNYNGFYLYENADKKIVNNISEDLNNLLTDFLKNL